MRRLNLYEMYELGQALNKISDIPNDATLNTHLWVLWSASAQLNKVLQEDSFLLSSSRRAAKKLLGIIDKCTPNELPSNEELEKPLGYRAFEIGKQAKNLETVLANEMPDVASYIVSQRGIYRTDDLIERAENHIASTVMPYLPDRSRDDLRAAGKSLAYELPMACAFHLWRAVETVMAVYYKHLAGVDFKKNGRNWAKYIEQLDKAGADKRVTAFLDHIREAYRNPQTHPDESVSIVDAQMLFGVAISAIDQMLFRCHDIAASKINLLTGGSAITTAMLLGSAQSPRDEEE